MIWFELLLELTVFLIDFALSGILGRGTSGPRQRHRSRVQILKAKERNKCIRRWLAKGDQKGPVPDLGLRCRQCEYLLTGLTGDTCPECGSPFDLATFIDPEVDGLRPCGHSKNPRWENVCQICGNVVPRICPRCGYEIKGMGARQPCPECGMPYQEVD